MLLKHRQETVVQNNHSNKRVLHLQSPKQNTFIY